jgi:hypothetical protein
MSETVIFRARQVRYISLDRQFQIEIGPDQVRLTPQKGLKAVAGPALGYGAFLGGLIGALLGTLWDRKLTKQKGSPDQGLVSSSTGSTPDDVVFAKAEFVKNKVSAAPRSGNAMIERRFGDWKFTLSSGKRYHFVLEAPDQLNLAIPALTDHFAESIEVNARWSEKHKRYLPARRRPFG